MFYLGNTLPYQRDVAIFERERKQINLLFFPRPRRYANRVLGSSSLWTWLNHLEAIFVKDSSEDISVSLNTKMQLWGRPGHWRVFSCIPGLCSLDISSIPHPTFWQPRLSPDITKYPWGAKSAPGENHCFKSSIWKPSCPSKKSDS